MNKIDDAALETVNGGLIVADDSLPFVYIAEDSNGSIRDENLSVTFSIRAVEKMGVSAEVISLEEYRRRYGSRAEL